jgi:hypothetical protein
MGAGSTRRFVATKQKCAENVVTEHVAALVFVVETIESVPRPQRPRFCPACGVRTPSGAFARA